MIKFSWKITDNESKNLLVEIFGQKNKAYIGINEEQEKVVLGKKR